MPAAALSGAHAPRTISHQVNPVSALFALTVDLHDRIERLAAHPATAKPKAEKLRQEIDDAVTAVDFNDAVLKEYLNRQPHTVLNAAENLQDGLDKLQGYGFGPAESPALQALTAQALTAIRRR